MGAGAARHGEAKVLSGGDDGLLAAIAQKAQDRFDLWSHAAGREMSGGEVALEFGGAHGGEWTLERLLVIEINEIGVGRDDKQIDAEPRGEKRGGTVFVDNGFDSNGLAVLAGDWNTASTTGDDQHAVINQLANHFEFDNFNGLGRRDDPAIASGGIFDDLPT